MSDEPKKRKRWLSRTLAGLVVLASYETVHYCTLHRGTALGSDHVCRLYERHSIGYKDVPPWVERLFEPANFIDAIPHLIQNWHQLLL